MNDIPSRIQELKAQLESMERADRYRKEMERQLHLEQAKVDRYRLQMISEEMDHARLRLPKLRMEFVKFEQEIKEVFQFAELESWEHNQWEGIRQVQHLVKELSEFTQTFLHGLIRDWLLQQQLHRTHTLTNQLKHESETTVKWLGLEQRKIKREIDHLEKERRDLLS